jgi:hypothetical protein
MTEKKCGQAEPLGVTLDHGCSAAARTGARARAAGVARAVKGRLARINNTLAQLDLPCCRFSDHR